MANPSSTHHEASSHPSNVLPGSILWLQSKNKCDATALPLNPDLDDGCYDHPVLILHADSAQAQASILLHVPVFPCGAHPDHGAQLFLADGLRLRRDSYVKTEWRYAVPWGFLAAYDDSPRRFALHPASYRDLMAYLRTPFVRAEPSLEPGRGDGDGDGGAAGEEAGARECHGAGGDADKVNPAMHACRVEFGGADVDQSNAAGFLADLLGFALRWMLIPVRGLDGRIG